MTFLTTPLLCSEQGNGNDSDKYGMKQGLTVDESQFCQKTCTKDMLIEIYS